MCDRAIWLKHGAVSGEGDPSELVDAYTEMMLGENLRGADGSIRRGSGEIQVMSVEMHVNGRAEPVKRFRTGDDVRLVLSYRAERSVPRPVVGIEIEHLGGTTLSAPCTRDVGLVPAQLSGEGVVTVDLSRVALLPGTYDLHTVLTDFNRSHVYDHLQTALRFDVMSGKPYEVGGLVTLRPEWSVH